MIKTETCHGLRLIEKLWDLTSQSVPHFVVFGIVMCSRVEEVETVVARPSPQEEVDTPRMRLMILHCQCRGQVSHYYSFYSEYIASFI